jgi:hypothetical protein
VAESRPKVLEFTASVGADGRVTALGESLLPPGSWSPEHLVLAPPHDDLEALLAKAERDCFAGASLTAEPTYIWNVA